MRTRMPVLLVACLMAIRAFGVETYESFAKESLGLDLTKIAFGESAGTNASYGKTDAPLSAAGLPEAAGIVWMTNETSAKYHQDFGNRLLKYGFREGKLAAVRISISAFGGPGFQGNLEWNQVEERRKPMVQLQDKYSKLRKAMKESPDLDRYDIRYGAMCSPTPESLFVMEFQITLHGKDILTPPGSGLDVHPKR